jgi:hypothetical protein
MLLPLHKWPVLGPMLCLTLMPVPLAAAEWTGDLGLEVRAFKHAPLDPRQHDNNLSVSAEPEFYHAWDDDQQSFTFTPFIRWDQHDEERSHADIRELLWLKAADSWELRAGVSKVFWGVTESQHLVDIVNQSDLIENPDGEDKLGQPMINLALIQDWGTLSLFVLPGFREQTFPGEDGRLRSQPYVDTSQAIYESENKDKHVDYAARWSHYIGSWDFGLSAFHGTSRNPDFVLGTDEDGDPALIPYYPLIDQAGLDLQATLGSWLWKLEAIRRNGQGDNYAAFTAGFEYTLVGILETVMDLGLITEVLHDSRGDKATTPFSHDVMLGLRLAINDAASTEILMGLIADTDTEAKLYRLEASHRLTPHWTLSLEGNAFETIPTDDPMYGMRRDSYLQLDMMYYF